uniref:Uncharacterized protein n=1 Tax=Heterorhabditis bacteriophora TaxID=37862 RepID=A0A1I7XBB5_HETBA
MSDRLKPLTILLISVLLLSSNALSNKKNYNNNIAYRNEATKEQSHLNLKRQKGESPSHMVRIYFNSLCDSNYLANPLIPYQFQSIECCDGRLETFMREAIAVGISTPKLGDAAKL